MFDVLEHIQDDIGMLKQLKRILQIGGRVYIAVPTFDMLWSKEDVFGGHYRRYTIASLERVLVAAGFAIEASTYMFQCLWLPILLLRALPSRLHLSVSVEEESRARHEMPRNRVLEAVLDREYRAIRSGRKISFGSSCIVVARA
ncbi:MAG TPA: methyltransferase domain-containing protein [Gemmatimonadaceae bacterium]|jgi:hypothetical protein|nr:methyltransferase domain-containing protein [Gemmatimonadaceae bacterium]